MRLMPREKEQDGEESATFIKKKAGLVMDSVRWKVRHVRRSATGIMARRSHDPVEREPTNERSRDAGTVPELQPEEGSQD